MHEERSKHTQIMRSTEGRIMKFLAGGENFILKIRIKFGTEVNEKNYRASLY